jgi:hypothetical protein
MSDEDKELLGLLVDGYVIQAHDLLGYDGYEYRLVKYGREVTSGQISRMLDRGWVNSSNTSYRLSDEGKKEYLRSTDELRRDPAALTARENDSEKG